MDIKTILIPFFVVTALNAAAVGLAGAAIITPKDSITVAGQVLNIPQGHSRTIVIDECDISDKSERRFSQVDPDGCFHERIPFSFGHTFSVNYDRKVFVKAYAEPGDSVFIRLDVSKSPMEFHVSGSHAELNEAYSHASNALQSVSWDVCLLPDTCSLADYMPVFKSEIGRTRKIVEEYIEKNSISDEVAELLFLDNTFNIANLAVCFTGKNDEERFAFLTDPIFDLTNERNARVMIFPFHLNSLSLHFPDYVQQLPKGIIRDLMYAANGSEIVPPRSEFANQAYYDRLFGSPTTEEIDIESIKTGGISVWENDSVYNLDDNEDPIEWLLQRFEGQPVYVDCSATWCGPCRASLLKSESVRTFFKDSEIGFAIIWLKSDRDSWGSFAPAIHNAVQLYVDDDNTSNRLMDILGIKGFPSYFLIDRHGKLTADGVPNYLNPDLVEFLKKALEK